MSAIINFDGFWQLLPYIYQSLVAGVILAVVAGLLGPLIQVRDASFAVHGTSELSFAGASAALFFGFSVNGGAVVGSLLAAVILALMRVDKRGNNAVIGILLPFGLGLGVLFLALFKGRSSNKFGLLTGQIVSVDENQLLWFAIIGALVVLVLAIFGRAMFFSAVDPEVARVRGVPLRLMSLLFMVILGLVVALSVQMVGALLVLSLLITPAAAAARVTASPVWMHILSVLFACTAAVGGILLSLGPGLPISPYITTISFLIFLICWGVGTWRQRRGWGGRKLEA